MSTSRGPAEFLGLKEARDLDGWLKTATKEQMVERHIYCSQRIGSAKSGLVINGALSFVLSPSNIVSVVINDQQLAIARQEQGKIEMAAKARLGVDFRRGENRVPRRRHKLFGAGIKTGVSVVLLGQDDVFALVTAFLGLDLRNPLTETELEFKAGSDMLYKNSLVSGLQFLGGEPAQEVEETFGIHHNPTWYEVLQAPHPELIASEAAVTGVAAEANVVMLGADVAGEHVHKQMVRASQRRR